MRARRFLLVAVVAAVVTSALQLPAEPPDEAVAARHASAETSVVRKATFFPVADAYTRADFPRTNFGRARELIVEGRPLSTVFLRFHPRGVGSLVQARLRVFVLRNPGRLMIHRTGGRGWAEQRITFRRAPRVGPPAGFPEATRSGWLEFDVTSLARLNRPFTIAITRTSPQKLWIASREWRGRAPRLVVESEQVTTPVVAAAGDIACSPSDSHFNRGLGTPRHCRMHETYQLLRALDPDVVLGLGDNQNSLATLDEFMGGFDRTWGKLKPLIRPAPGNWEYRVPGAAGYYQYFGQAAGDPSKGYYSFDFGGWHFIALNSNCRDVGGCGPDAPQVSWLRADLAANRSQCTLAFSHDPRFSSSPGGDRLLLDPLWRALADNGVTLLLSGGSHIYERYVPLDADARPQAGGTRQIIAGTGGHSGGGLGTPRSISVVRDNETFGVLRLSLRPDGFDWRFVPEAGRSFTDRGSASCR